MTLSISVSGLVKTYPQSDFRLAIESFSFSNEKINVLTGPNGSGKSTLLKLISGVEKPDRGTIVTDKVRIGYCMQKPYLFDMTVYDNIALGLKLGRISRKEIEAEVFPLMERFQLTRLKSKSVRTLSAGEYQKTALAQVLALKPGILILDEPASALDARSQLAVEETVKDFFTSHKALILCTTHSADQAARLSPYSVQMIEGRISGEKTGNVFTGPLLPIDHGLKAMEVAPSVRIIVATEKEGPGTIAIDPESILVSDQPIHTSAMNHFRGKITAIEEKGPNVRLLIDAGFNLYVLITAKSFSELGLAEGRDVFLAFKVNSVRVI